MGSPPTVRGKVAGNLEQGRVVGITPACAGKSWSRRAESRKKRDHPRMCGEKGHGSELRGWQVGSPPRMQGKAALRLLCFFAARITPACAGKSKNLRFPRIGNKDHPRMCGEKAANFRAECGPRGSPPRVRGKVHVCHCSLIRRRITPACAGKSVRRENSSS